MTDQELLIPPKNNTLLSEEEFEDTKGQPQSVNQRRTDNTMAKRNKTNNDLQNFTQKTYHQATQTLLKMLPDLTHQNCYYPPPQKILFCCYMIDA